MKTAKEIKSHIEDLEKIVSRPCPYHEDPGHDQQSCALGGLQMMAAIRVLKWVIGIDEEYDRMVETLAAAERY